MGAQIWSHTVRKLEDDNVISKVTWDVAGRQAHRHGLSESARKDLFQRLSLALPEIVSDHPEHYFAVEPDPTGMADSVVRFLRDDFERAVTAQAVQLIGGGH